MIEYRDNTDGLTAGALRGGFWEGWPSHPSPETHLRILENSDQVVVALDDATGQVVGFITAISDGVLSAYIPLLEVLPAYRRHGIASELVRRMLSQLDGLYMIDLLCDPELQPFYERLGMRSTQGMFVRNYARQTGEPR